MNPLKISETILCVLVLVISLFTGLSLSEPLEEGEKEKEVDIDIKILVHDCDGYHEYDFLWTRDDYEVIEEYESYILVETSEEKTQFLENRGYKIERLHNWDYVGLRSHPFYTSKGEPDIDEELKIDEYTSKEKGYYILQFIGPIRSQWKEELGEKGVGLHEFRHRFNYIVEMDLETKREVEDLYFVDWIGIYHPAYRFDSELVEKSGEHSFDVTVFESQDPDLIGRKIEETGGEVQYISRNRINVEIDTGKIEDLARLHGVHSISSGPGETTIANAHATWITQTNEQDDRKITEEGVTGQGELITVCDSELYGGKSDNPDHEMWEDSDGDPVGDDHRKIQEHYAIGGGGIEGGVYHGTHVTGTALGGSSPYSEYSNHDGNAMGARLIFQDIGPPQERYLLPPEDMYEDAWGVSHDSGSRIHTNSWGGGVTGGYSEKVIEGDEFVWDNKDYNIFFAIGNDGDSSGTMNDEAEGKNFFSVGAAVNYNYQDYVASFSSRGYANDGRIKPTMLHVGDVVHSAEMSTDGYESMSGTSMATPGLAGQAAQVRQYYREGYQQDGTPNPSAGFDPSNALVRATLINGAVEISGDGAYQNDARFPNNDQGFGRSKLDRVMHFEDDERKLIAYDSLEEGVELDTGQSWDMTFDVEDATQELEITLAWSDYPGSEGSDESDPAIVNDLDLEVTAPDGTRYVGNAFTSHNPGYSEPEPTSNHWSGLRDGENDGLNVEENVLLLPDHNDIQEGRYQVSVDAHQVPEDTQPFGLVITGGVRDEPEGENPTIDITRPTGVEEWEARTDQNIEWSAQGGDDPVDTINLYYSVDGGDSFNMIDSGIQNTGSYTWEVPNEDSETCKVRAEVYDEVGRSGEETSEMFTIEGFPPSPPGDIEVKYVEDALENGNFVNGDEGWTLEREQDGGQASIDDSEQYEEGSSISVRAHQDGDGTTIEESYWEQGMIPTENEVIVNGAFSKNIELEHDECSVPTATAEIQVYDSDSGWETIVSNDDTSEGEMSWQKFGEVNYEPKGLIESVRAKMHVEAEGYSDFIFDHEATGEIWMDEISIEIIGGSEGDHNLIEWGSSPDDPEGVGHYNVYRAEDKNGPWDDILTEVDADGSERYGYMDEDVSGDPHHWYLIRAVGENGLEEDNYHSVAEPGIDQVMTIKDPDPPDGYEGVSIKTDLSVLVEHDEGEEMDVHFHDASDPSKIGTIEDVADGARAEILSEDLDEGTTYYWYVEADDGEDAVRSDTWSFTTIDKDEPFFEVEIVDHDAEVKVGEEVSVQYTVTNTGDAEDTQAIEFYVGDRLEDDLKLSLDSGNSEELEFIWIPEETGDHALSIHSDDDSDEVTVSVIEKGEESVLNIDVEGGGTTDPEPGEHSYEEGEEVSVKAVSEEGWEFVEWTGDETSTESTIEITMDEDKEITAQFEEETAEEYELTINVEGEGSTDPVEGSHGYTEGDEVTVTATPVEDWYFEGWTGDHVGTDEEILIKMEDDKEITAVFDTDLGTHDLMIKVEGEGTTDPESGTYTYEEGREVTVTADPAEDWWFEEWTGDHTGTDEDITITMEDDKEITAHFESDETGEIYDLTIIIDGEGTTDPEEGIHTYNEGEEVTVTAYPNEGQVFEEWTGDHESTEEEITIKMDDNKEITAHFEEEKANFEVEIIDYEENVTEDEDVTIRFRVTNTGGMEESRFIMLYSDGEQVKVYGEVVLGPGEKYVGEFILELEEVGEHEFAVDSSDSQESININVMGDDDIDDEDEEEDRIVADYWWLIVVLLIGVIAVVCSIFISGMKKDKKDATPSDESSKSSRSLGQLQSSRGGGSEEALESGCECEGQWQHGSD